MILINIKGNIKEQFSQEGLCYPHKKSSGKFGLPQSSLLDRNTEEESLKAVLNYLEDKKIIKKNE